MKRLKVKSSDLTSDRVNDTDSKPCNNTGIYTLKKNKLQYYFVGCNPTNLAKMAFTERKNDFLWLSVALLKCVTEQYGLLIAIDDAMLK